MGITVRVPPGRKPRFGPVPEPVNNPGSPTPVPPPPGGGADKLSSPILMTVGMCPGCKNLAGSMFVCGAEGPALRTTGAVSTTTRPRLMGVETVRAAGSPMVFHSGNNSKQPIISACSPNDVSVVQLRRVRWAQEVSTILSANMLSSRREICLLVWTPRTLKLSMRPQRKKATFSRGLLELSPAPRGVR